MSHPQATFRQSAFHGNSMLSVRRGTFARSAIHTQLKQMKSTGRYDCFNLKWKPIYEDHSRWPVPLHLFWDSDIAKWIEGACYLLVDEYDAEIDAAIREIVDMIRGAQQDDGYLNVHYTVVEPDKRWSNVKDMHELYNAGHLMEAALAHRQYYKNDLLMEPIGKYIALIRKVFGPGAGQRRGYPGHPEIELALLRFYTVTRNQDAYDLARFFLEERGNPNGQDGKHYYDWETEMRGESPWQRPNSWPMSRDYWYCQAHVPILEQQTIEGHSVRAMYLLTGVAELVILDQRKDKALSNTVEWTKTLKRLWNNMVDRKMYLTGGIGSMAQWEGFGIDYFLPQGTDEGGCYSETCASIGVIMLAERMLHIDLDSRYADVLELCLYNTVMTAMSLDGKTYTYENQLASSHKFKSGREDWFWCACCPPNLLRLFGSLGGYLWDHGGSDGEAYVNVHLYTSAKVTFPAGDKSITLSQKSNWPWEGNMLFQLSGAEDVKTTIRLRLPAWSMEKYVVTPTPRSGTAKVTKGYLTLSPSYLAENPVFSLIIQGFEPRYISPHPYTNQRTLTLARGPIVYCIEDADNPWETNHFKDLAIKVDSPASEEHRVDSGTGEEYIALHTTGWKRSMEGWEANTAGDGPSYSHHGEQFGEERGLVFVPYYFRSNRGGKGQMRVGLLNAGAQGGRDMSCGQWHSSLPARLTNVTTG